MSQADHKVIYEYFVNFYSGNVPMSEVEVVLDVVNSLASC